MLWRGLDLSPETSLRWHAGKTTIPLQVIVHTKTGSNINIALKFDTALFDYKAKDFAPVEDMVIEHGLQLLSLPATPIRTTPSAYSDNP